MKNSFIKSLLLLITVSALCFTLASCKGNKYRYPSETPAISNPNEVFLTLGDMVVTKEQIYRRSMVNNGYGTLNDIVDDKILPTFDELTAEQKADYDDYKQQVIYGSNYEKLTEKEKAETMEEFEDAMFLQGLFTKEDYEAYMQLDYRRYMYAYNQEAKKVAEFEPIKNDKGDITQKEYFTEAEREAAIGTLYPDTATVIFLSFRSLQEARKMMEANDIYVDEFNYKGWQHLEVDENGNKSAGSFFTQTEVYDAFIAMYNELYGYAGSKIDKGYRLINGEYAWELTENENGYNNFVYTYDELSQVSNVVALKVFSNLDDKKWENSYTIAPNTYLTSSYLALRADYNEVLLRDYKEADILKQEIESKLSNDTVNIYLYEAREAAGLKIYDEGLETAYASAVEQIYSNAKVEYAGYERTTDEDSKNVASFTLDGNTVYVSADELYDEMVGRFGLSLAVGYMNQAVLLNKYSTILNVVTGEILDQEAYDEIYETEIQSYIDELKKDTFAAVGYPKNYGFENFIRDRFGALTEMELIASGDIYQKALDVYGEQRYVFSNDASTAILALAKQLDEGKIKRDKYEEGIAKYVDEAELTVEYQMQKIYDEFFSVNAFIFSAYVDYDHNEAADELLEGSTSDATGKLLVNYLLEKAKSTDVAGSTYYQRLTKLVSDYRLVAFNDATEITPEGSPLVITFGDCKRAGINLKLTAQTDYTNANTDLAEDTMDILKTIWNDIKDNGHDGKKFSSSLLSMSFSEGYASEFYDNNNAWSRVVVTRATDATYTTTTTRIQLPTKDIIDRYIIANKPDAEKTDEELEVSVTTKETNAVKAYYTPAIESLTNDDVLGRALIAERAVMFEKGTFTFKDTNINSLYDKLIELSLAE